MSGTFEREEIIGYATVAGLAIVPAASLIAVDLPATNGSYPFVTFSLVLLLVLCLLRPLCLVTRRHPTPTRQLLADVKTNWPWLATSLFMAVALPQTLDSATSLKRLIPELHPYYADDALIRLDALIGIDPWRLTHAIFGAAATRLLDTLYGLWHVGQIGLAMWLVLSRHRPFQLQAALSFQLAWLLMGGLLAIAFASVGPCFVDDFFGNERYAPLMARLPDDLHSATAMKYLLASQGTEAIGGGISAMPSLHVAISVLIGLCLRNRLPRWQWLAWAYAAAIYLASIHLGWHYASDGIVSAVGMVAIWKAAGWYVEWLGRPRRRATLRVA
jgi:hypothetical protein